MTIGLLLLIAYALSLAAIAIAVAGRLALCGWRVARAGRAGLAAACVGGFVLIAALVAWVAAVGFAYGVAHSMKTVWTDARAAALAGVPLVVAGYALWRMAVRFESSLGAGRG